jgi:hypothetical protein
VTERWLDKKALAAHFSCSVRSIEYALHEGMRDCGAIIFGRWKCQPSAAERWLEKHGRLRRIGADASVASANGAATATTAPPHDREVSPDGEEG